MFCEVYVDALFLWNLTADLCALLIAETLTNCRISVKQLWLSALTGALGSVVLWIPLGNAVWFKTCVIFICTSAVMVVVAFRVRTGRQFLSAMMILFIATATLAGTAGRVSIHANVYIRFIFSCITMIGLTILLRIGIRKIHQIRKTLLAVSLFHNGEEITVAALFDSGNGLYDNKRKKGICVLEQSVCKFDTQTCVGQVPFHTVGTSDGRLNVYLVERAVIHTCIGDVKCDNMPIALCAEKLSKDNRYHMILHEDYLKRL